MRPSNPRRLELGPESYDQQHGKVSIRSTARPNSFQARRIDPMRVLEDHQHRTFACKRLDLRRERFQRFLPTLLRCQFERGITSIIRQRQHFGKERGVLMWRLNFAPAPHRACRASLAVSSCANPSGTLHLANDRIRDALSVCCGEQK